MSIGVYLTAAESPSAWPAPWEKAYQAQTRWGERVPGARRPDSTYPERLLIASIVNLWDDRPHGMITWSAEAFRVSRETIYEIGRQWSPQRTLEKVAEPPPSITPPEDGPEPITSTHFARSVAELHAAESEGPE